MKGLVFSATFNNVLVISWRPVLLVEESVVQGENHRPVTEPWQSLPYIVVSSTPLLGGIWTHNVRGNRHWLHSSYNSKYHTIRTTKDPFIIPVDIIIYWKLWFFNSCHVIYFWRTYKDWIFIKRILAILLSVLLRFTDFDYPFGLFKPFLLNIDNTYQA